jgi:single-stranded-DNA-specific exonuclease
MIKELESLGDKKIDDDLLIKQHSADMILDLNATSLALAKLLHSLEPFGMANQKPKFLLENLTVIEDRKLGDAGKHRKLTIEQNGTTCELMLFNTKESYPLKYIKAVICTIDINVWQGRETLQLIGSYVET